jgi:hypothetical protein
MKILMREKEGVIGEWRQIRNEELRNLYFHNILLGRR